MSCKPTCILRTKNNVIFDQPMPSQYSTQTTKHPNYKIPSCFRLETGPLNWPGIHLWKKSSKLCYVTLRRRFSFSTSPLEPIAYCSWSLRSFLQAWLYRTVQAGLCSKKRASSNGQSTSPVSLTLISLSWSNVPCICVRYTLTSQATPMYGHHIEPLWGICLAGQTLLFAESLLDWIKRLKKWLTNSIFQWFSNYIKVKIW